MKKTSIREWGEGMGVEIGQLAPESVDHYRSVMQDEEIKAHLDKRWVIKAFNEAGFNSTEVDLIDLLVYVRKEMPNIWERI